MSSEACGNCGHDVTNEEREYLCDACARALSVNRPDEGGLRMRPDVGEVIVRIRRLNREGGGFPPSLADWEALVDMANVAVNA